MNLYLDFWKFSETRWLIYEYLFFWFVQTQVHYSNSQELFFTYKLKCSWFPDIAPYFDK